MTVLVVNVASHGKDQNVEVEEIIEQNKCQVIKFRVREENALTSFFEVAESHVLARANQKYSSFARGKEPQNPRMNVVRLDFPGKDIYTLPMYTVTNRL